MGLGESGARPGGELAPKRSTSRRVMMSQVSLSKEDKEKFRAEISYANPVEVLAVGQFVEECSQFSEKDKKFMRSCIGKRCEQLLRNVAHTQSWDGKGYRQNQEKRFDF